MGKVLAFAVTHSDSPPFSFDDETEKASRPTTFRVGEIVAGRYEIQRFVAQGGMGEVYAAYDLELRECVALKSIRRELAEDPQVLQRFKREIRLARRVTHPSSCRVYELGCTDDRVFFLTMELLQGPTLAQRLEEGPISTAEALAITRQIAEALSAAHECGVTHRDLKPANVILTRNAKGGVRAVVTDFGLARHTFEESSVTQGLIGTPEYMAPEQLLGAVIGPSTDLYSLGVMLFEMVTGQLPFRGTGALETAAMRLHTPPVSPRGLVPALDRRVEELILRCLCLDSVERPVSADAVIAEIEALSAARPPRASAPPPVLALAAIAIALLALLVP